MRPQAIVQPKQAWLFTRLGLPSVFLGVCMASAEMSFAPSNCTSRWLRVGRAPISLITFIRTCVPYLGSPCPVTAFSASTFLAATVAFMNAAGSLTLPTPLVPRTAMALRFFEPITVPTPERPAARCRSFTTAAYRQPVSPAGPMPETRTCGSWNLFLSQASVSHVDLPQIAEASRRWAESFSMCRYTGLGDLPSTMIMSQPAILSSAPK